MTFITTGGVIDGPKLHGEVLPGGGDWLLAGATASDGWTCGRLCAPTTVCSSTTRRAASQDPCRRTRRLAAGEVLSFDETYVRTTTKFETADERYAWLNEVVAVGYNILSPNHIDYRIYRVR